MSDLDLQSILKFTVALAYEAGDVIRKGSEAIQLAGSNRRREEKLGRSRYRVRCQGRGACEEEDRRDVPFVQIVSVTFVIVPRVRQFSSIGEESYAAGSRPGMDR